MVFTALPLVISVYSRNSLFKSSIPISCSVSYTSYNMGERMPPQEVKRYKSVFHPETSEAHYAHPVFIIPGIGETGEKTFGQFTKNMAVAGHEAYAITQLTTK